MAETASPNLAAERRSIVGLDLIRFLAAVFVVVYHLGYWAWAPPPGRASIRALFPSAPRFPDLEPVAWLGWVGVQIFFVISGFVITSSARRASPYLFLRGRILRLTPAILVCGTLSFIVLLLTRGSDPAVLQSYGRTLALPFFPRGPWIDSVYWTLIVEFVFYAAIFGLLAVGGFSRIAQFAMAMGLASSSLWFGYALFGLGDWFLGTWQAKLSLARYGCFFAAGVLLWLALFDRATVLRVLVLAACIAAGVVEIGFRTRETVAIVGRELPAAAPQALFLGGVGAIVLSVALNRRLHALLAWRVRLVAMLGLMTYPLYLIHNVAGVSLMNALVRRGVEQHAAFVVGGGAMVALAWAISRWAEPKTAALLQAPLNGAAALGRRAPPLAWLFRGAQQDPGPPRGWR